MNLVTELRSSGQPDLVHNRCGHPGLRTLLLLGVRRTAAWVAAVFGLVQIAGYVVADQLQTTAVTCFELLSGAAEGKLAVCALRFFYRNTLNRKLRSTGSLCVGACLIERENITISAYRIEFSEDHHEFFEQPELVTPFGLPAISFAT